MQTVGILIDNKLFQRIRRSRTGNDELRLYNRAAKQLGLQAAYLCLSSINLQGGTVRSLRYENGAYREERIRLPRVIYNRSLARTRALKARLRQLNRHTYVFNANSRYSKFHIHQLLVKANRGHLPPTVRYNDVNLRRMMQRHPSLYIKPQDSSLGNGIIKISRQSNKSWLLHKPQGTLRASTNQVTRHIHRMTRRKAYLIQKEIPLARFQGRAYDIRVSVQRNRYGAWQVTGMLGRVARSGSHVTNVAQGGSVIDVHTLLRHSFAQPERIKKTVRSLSLRITRHLSRKLPNLADLGIDIGVSRSGKPYFIEVNCRYLRKGFKRAGLTRTYNQIHKVPIEYASRVLRGRSH